MGIFDQTPSIRKDTEFFNKALKELGWTFKQYNNKLRKIGIDLGDNVSKKNFLNKSLRDIGSKLQYKNIITAPKKINTEIKMGGNKPGTVGAPENAKIWEDGSKVQEQAEKKFKNKTDQRKFFVDKMKKIYKGTSKKEILRLFRNVGLKGLGFFALLDDEIGILAGDAGAAEDDEMFAKRDSEKIKTDMMKKSGITQEMVDKVANTKVDLLKPMNKGGMMNIDYMTRPLGMRKGGDPEMEFEKRKRIMEKTTLDQDYKNAIPSEDTIEGMAYKLAAEQGDTSMDNVNLIIQQLMALSPSVEQDIKKEYTPLSTQGLKYLFDKMNVMTGIKSDPKLNRNIGFDRVK